MNTDIGDGSKGVQLVIDDPPKKATRLRGGRVRSRGGTQNPSFPRGVVRRKEFIDEFHEKTFILELQVFDPQPTTFFRSLDSVPSHKALGPVALVLTSPEESASSLVDGLDHRLGDAERGHEVKRHRAEHRGAQGKAPSTVQEGGLPTGQVPVTRGDEREAVRDRNFVGAEGKAKVSLGEARSSSAEGGGKGIGFSSWDMNGKEGRLMIVDGEASGVLKELKDLFGS